MTAIWTVRIPSWHPARINQWDGRHWAVRAKAKAIDREMVAAYCLAAGIPPAVCKRLVRLRIILGPRQRGGDVDSYWKSLLDALVACRRLKDDSKEWLEFSTVEYGRGSERATEIVLQDILEESGNLQDSKPEKS